MSERKEKQNIKKVNTMSDWEEVKRLAADFQRAQLSSTTHKLSERNCVELVQKLINLGLIDVIYTTDGREYLTPSELEKEVREELFVEGGNFIKEEDLMLRNRLLYSFKMKVPCVPYIYLSLDPSPLPKSALCKEYGEDPWH